MRPAGEGPYVLTLERGIGKDEVALPMLFWHCVVGLLQIISGIGVSKPRQCNSKFCGQLL